MIHFKNPAACWLVCLGGLSIIFATPSYAAPGQLSQLPLFVSKSNVQPNIFFELDDSSSMDTEILTQPYWNRCVYIGNDRFRTTDCTTPSSIVLQTNSYFHSIGVADTTTLISYGYIYDNPDNFFSGSTCSTKSDFASIRCLKKGIDYDWRVFSPSLNMMYYNPSITYLPWQGTGMSNASFTAARSNPQTTSIAGSDAVKNLGADGGFILEIWEDSHGFDKKDERPRRGSFTNRTEGANGLVDYWDNHRRYTVTETEISYQDVTYTVDKTQMEPVLSPKVTLTTGLNGRTLAAEQQNIANWYQYYRRRSFVAKSAIAKVTSENPDYQYGLSVINYPKSLFVPINGGDLQSKLFNYDWGSVRTATVGTPLRVGLNNVGKYFMGVSSNAGTFPSPITSECQQNFAIVFSDGYWDVDTDTKVGDVDKDKYENTLADVAKYYYDTDLSALPNNVPISTFDKQSQQHLVTFTIAFGLQGKLVAGNDGWPNPALKENNDWGDPHRDKDIPEKLDDMWHAAYNSKGTFLSANSPEAVSQGFANILASIGGRGGGSASGLSFNTNTLTGTIAVYQTQFNSPDLSAKSDQKDWTGNIAAYTLNLTTGKASTSVTWNAAEKITASLESTRKMFTYNRDTKKGIPFKWDNLSENQKKDLLTNSDGSIDTLTAGSAKAQARLAYLRGNKSNEGTGTTYQFRKRSQLLSDVIHSDPLFVGRPRDSWPAAAPFPVDTKSYSNFVSAKANRQKIVYVGANDGMLHGLNASSADGSGLGTGAEMMAYIPNALFSSGNAVSGLHYLTDPNYSHLYYVDMPTSVGDAYFDTGDGQGTAWHSVLLGGYRAGGRGIFALDVTDPTKFTEANAAKIALWEFDSTDDADMGYSFAKPTISMMPNNRWAAIFGNGYNSSGTGSATLFVVFLDGGLDGTWTTTGKTPDYVKITAPTDADKITSGNCLNSASDCNGLSSPQAVDSNGDYKVDRVYAGDLRGNLWAFDLSDTDPDKWKVAYETSAKKPAPLFTASHHITPTTGTNRTPVQQKLCSGQACMQQITNKPIVVKNPLVSAGNINVLVFFGTGQYLKATDPASTDIQSFYGVWDHGVAELTPVNLVEQTFLPGPFYTQDNIKRTDIRVLSNNSVLYDKANITTNQGWFINLEIKNEKSEQINKGERLIVDAVLRIVDNSNIENNDKIFFNTWIPEAQECSAGGKSKLMSVNMIDGSNPKTPAFDLNKDGIMNSESDTVLVNGVYVGVAGEDYNNGFANSPAITQDTQVTGGTGTTKLDMRKVEQSPPMRRISWQELRNN